MMDRDDTMDLVYPSVDFPAGVICLCFVFMGWIRRATKRQRRELVAGWGLSTIMTHLVAKNSEKLKGKSYALNIYYV